MPSFDGWRWERRNREGVGTIPGRHKKIVFKKEGVSAGHCFRSLPIRDQEDAYHYLLFHILGVLAKIISEKNKESFLSWKRSKMATIYK